MKECTKCRKLKDEKEFVNDKGKVVKTCKSCRDYSKEYMKVYYARNKEQIKERIKEYHERNKEQIKERKKEHYARNKERIKEYHERNKEQIKERKKEYYTRNKERIKEYRERNKEQIKEQQKEYRERNKEQIKEYEKEYRERNKEQIKEQQKEYRERNKEQIKENRRRSAKYETYAHKLTVEESPRKGKRGELLVRCTKCGEYFAPTNSDVKNRVNALEGKLPGEYRLYCSQECKDTCEIYWVNYDPYAKHSSVERDPAWAKMVKERANFICERCGSTSELEAHHEIPVKMNPELVSDEDNGICLCRECHMKAHAEDGCTLSDLRKL